MPFGRSKKKPVKIADKGDVDCEWTTWAPFASKLA